MSKINMKGTCTTLKLKRKQIFLKIKKDFKSYIYFNTYHHPKNQNGNRFA